MLMTNVHGDRIYYNVIAKHDNTRFVVRALSGQYILGRDRQKARSRTFAQEHQADAWLRRNGYEPI